MLISCRHDRVSKVTVRPEMISGNLPASGEWLTYPVSSRGIKSIVEYSEEVVCSPICNFQAGETCQLLSVPSAPLTLFARSCVVEGAFLSLDHAPSLMEYLWWLRGVAARRV